MISLKDAVGVPDNKFRRAQAIAEVGQGLHLQHQLAIASALTAKNFKFARKVELDYLINQYKLKFVTIPAECDRRGMTIAYHTQRRDVLRVATAILHPTDQYDKIEGRFQAATYFASGNWITLHKPGTQGATEYLRDVFDLAATK